MKTQTTKPGWGLVALASLMVAGTCFGSFWLTLASLALFAFSAWRGGYMEGTSQKLSNNLTTSANAEERR